MIRRILAAVTAGLLATAGWTAPARAGAAPYGTVTGTFVAADGTPIVNSHIVVESNLDKIVGWGYTDATGHYSIDLFGWAESVRLEFDHGWMKQWAHQKTDAAGATLYPIASGVTVTVDETELPVGTVTGTYRSFTGEPIAGAAVYAYSPENRILANGSTGADGRYRVSPVPFGPVKLRFSDHNVEQWAHQKPDFASATTIQVPDAAPVVVDETQIELGTIRGEVTLPSGAPASDFYIFAAQAGGGPALSVGGTLEEDGRYRINVPAGRWRVGLDHDAVGVQYVPQKPKAADATVFTVTAGQEIEVDETLRPLGAVKGELTSASGRPVAERDVHLWKGDVQVRSQETDEAGGYLFSALEPGDYLVSWDNSDGSQTYVPGTLHRDQADRLAVRPGEVTVGNTRYTGPATVRGRLTTPDGAPLSKMFVDIKAVAGGYSYAEVTDANGEWSAGSITPEEYRISFRNTDTNLTQTVPGTFTLAANSTTTVDQEWTLGNTLRITAPDGFCASVNTWSGYCTDGATLTIAGLPAGPATVKVSPDNGSNYLPSGRIPVTVADGGITPLTVELEEGGRIALEIVDRINHIGQKQWCVVLAVPGEGFPSEESDVGCTHQNGKITTYAMRPGTFQMFVYSTASVGLGAQWVGETGGSGNQKDAAKIKIKAGKVTRPPAVLLDQGGTLTGKVRDATGAPMGKVNIGPDAWSLSGTPPFSESYPDGAYNVYEYLGPYDWPLVLTPKTGAAPRQLSGNVGNRYQAQTVKIEPGRVTTYDPVLVPGAHLTGTITTTRSFTKGRITAVNATTGDELAIADFTSDNRTYDLPVIGGGPVLLHWTLTGPAASGSLPDRISVPRTGTKTVDLNLD